MGQCMNGNPSVDWLVHKHTRGAVTQALEYAVTDAHTQTTIEDFVVGLSLWAVDEAVCIAIVQVVQAEDV